MVEENKQMLQNKNWQETIKQTPAEQLAILIPKMYGWCKMGKPALAKDALTWAVPQALEIIAEMKTPGDAIQEFRDYLQKINPENIGMKSFEQACRACEAGLNRSLTR